MSDGTLLWAEHHGVGCLKLSGELRHPLAEALERAAERLQRGGVQELVLDLADAHFMDSTVIGLLVLLARRQRQAGHAPPLLVLDHPDLLQMLRQLHLDGLFRLVAAPPIEASYRADGAAPGDTARQARLILAAHRALIAADPRNAAAFAGVVALFEDEVRRHAGPE
jgi:anti-anti-sigma factor